MKLMDARVHPLHLRASQTRMNVGISPRWVPRIELIIAGGGCKGSRARDAARHKID
jgi:hypothetical protein